MARFEILNYARRPQGQFAEYLGWALSWERGPMARGRIRFTVTATKDGFAPIWRDVALHETDSPAAMTALMSGTEADVRHVVSEVEELEGALRRTKRSGG